jgi:hypothetical protein
MLVVELGMVVTKVVVEGVDVVVVIFEVVVVGTVVVVGIIVVVVVTGGRTVETMHFSCWHPEGHL